jgi:hypothetical protein
VLRAFLLAALTDEQLARHKIVVGDPSSFQGDERDVMLLSMVASKGAMPTQVGRMYVVRDDDSKVRRLATTCQVSTAMWY